MIMTILKISQIFIYFILNCSLFSYSRIRLISIININYIFLWKISSSDSFFKIIFLYSFIASSLVSLIIYTNILFIYFILYGISCTFSFHFLLTKMIFLNIKSILISIFSKLIIILYISFIISSIMAIIS